MIFLYSLFVCDGSCEQVFNVNLMNEQCTVISNVQVQLCRVSPIIYFYSVELEVRAALLTEF